jgi:hypothetical protein
MMFEQNLYNHFCTENNKNGSQRNKIYFMKFRINNLDKIYTALKRDFKIARFSIFFL